MNINTNKLFFVDEKNKISMYKDFGNGIIIDANIFILTDKFFEYQKDLFSEFLSYLVELADKEERTSLKNFQKDFENLLQDINNKLETFAWKIKDVERFDLKGMVQVYFDDIYMSSMIGDVSTAIFRDGRINYIVDNDIQGNEKIDIFSDFIEGELESDDIIVAFGTKISDILDKNDLQEAINHYNESEESFVDVLKQFLESRYYIEHIYFLLYSNVEFELNLKKEDIKEKIFSNMTYLNNFKELLIKFRYPIVISLGFLFVVYLLYAMIMNFSSENVVKTDNGNTVVDFTIDDIKRDLEEFSRIDPDSDRKIKKYKQINERLALLRKEGKRLPDVKKLQTILDNLYKQGFNIEIINSLSDYNIFNLQENESSILGNIKSIIYNNFVHIGGSNGAILNMVNNDTRGRSVNYDIPVDISGCIQNLIGDGIYCYSKGGNIINVQSDGIEAISTDDGKFVDNIVGIGTFGESNIYTFVENNELNNKGTFILRYSNKPGSQVNFGKATEYQINPKDFKQNKSKFASGFSDMEIDGTFLTWGKKEKSVYQFKRNPDTGYLDYREVPITGGPDVAGGYSSNVDILTDKNSRFIYLFDKKNQHITAYRTAPYKTNTSYTTDYSMKYFFRLDFSISSNIKDVDMEFGNNHILHIVTDKGVSRINMQDYHKRYTEDEEQQN